jgi:hypothetical protein
MSKKIQLNIANPCHENWDAMTPVQQGKFCGSCQKQVVDFTSMSDRQLAEFFKKPSTGSVCGRFMTDQLDRAIDIPRKRIPWVRYFFTIALPALFFTRASAQKMGKVKAPPAKEPVHTPTLTEFRTVGMVIQDHIVPENTMKGIKAYVADAETGRPLAGASIIMNSSIGKENLLSDKDGFFILNTIRKITFYGIEISYPGYITRDIQSSQFRRAADGRIVFTLEKTKEINPAEIIMGDIEPVCTRTMGEISMPVDTAKKIGNMITGRVVDENGEPVAFASIETNQKGERIMADENGIFTINKNWLKKGKTLEVTSTGYAGKTVPTAEAPYKDGELWVELTPNVVLPEVVVTSLGITTRRMVLGGFTTVKGETISTVVKTENKVITESKLPMEENKLLVYPNPVTAGMAINLSFKQLEEGYYQLHIISPSGQLILQKEVWIDSEARLLNLDIPKVAAGNYFIVLINKMTGKKYSEKLIVQ